MSHSVTLSSHFSQMSKNKRPHISTNTHPRGSPLLDITSTINQLQNGASVPPKEVQALEYYSLLARARAVTDKAVERQSQNPAGPKRRKGVRGDGCTLRHRMEVVEIFHGLRKSGVKVTATNLQQFVHTPISRQSITLWDKDFDKIQFDVAHGRGNKCTLSRSPADLIRHIMDKTVQEWLLEVRKSDGIVSGLELQAAADSVHHIIMDDIYDVNDVPHGRPISFTTSWRSRMSQEHCVAYCILRGEAGSVDMDAIAGRMDEIRNICSEFKPDDIYNCGETSMYLRELSTHSYTMEELMSGAKPELGESRVSVLFCVNASGSSLDRAAKVEALRPQVFGKHLARGIQPCSKVPNTSMKHGKGYMTLDLFKRWLHSLDKSLTNRSLLLLDSCEAHGKFNDKDPLAEETWTHLRIERLPPNSTSVTQPLDAGIISAFKRHYLEMLSNISITKEYVTGEKITNGAAWSLIPYAWSLVRTLTVRHCFCKAGVLSEAQADELEQESVYVEERPPPLYPPVVDTNSSQVKRRYLRLIASVMDGDKVQFSLDENQKDAQDMAEEEIKQKLQHNMETKRSGSRDRSSSIESDVVESFKSKYGGESSAILVIDMLEGDASDREAAREVIRVCMQK